MIKTLLLTATILFFSSCNHTAPPKPDADRVIKDTLAQIFLQPFNQSPQEQNIYIRVDAKQEKMPCPRSTAIKQLMKELKTETQKFVIDNNQPVEITGQEGTKLSFAPNCFVNAEGNQVSTPVNIELKECYNLSDMLRENLLTANQGGYASGKGMLCVRAYADGKALQLKTGGAINVQFPFFTDNNDGYKLYRGDENADGLIVWNAVCEQKAAVPEINPSASYAKPQFSYLGLGLKEYLLQNLSYPDEARRNELSANLEVTFTVSKDGRVKNVVTAESYKIFRQEIEQSLTSMPAWKPAAYNGKNIASSVHVNIDFNIRSADQVKVDFDDAKSSLISTGNDLYVLYGSDLVRQKSGQSEQAINRVGWFNYSKPLDAGNKKAELIVCSNEKSEVKLLLKNKTIIIGAENCMGFADFQNLPLGQEAYIVAVRYDGGNMLYAVQPVTLSKQTVVTLQWKKGDKKEIAKVYRKLSKDLS
jgi:hypothetical protein